MRSGGLIRSNSIAICEMFKTSWQHGKTHYEWRFGEPFKGPIVPFGAVVEYYPISARDQSRLHQFGKKVLPGKTLDMRLKSWRRWTRQKYMLEGSMQTK